MESEPVPPPARTWTRGEVYGALRGKFGLAAFRPGQAEAIRAILAGRPTLAVLPTGAGKSLCYQLPAVLLEGTTVVVSPLIALMEDQVQALERRGVSAACLHGNQDLAARSDALTRLGQGVLDLVYVAPERLEHEGFRECVSRIEVPFVAVDEAHCVHQWGHDFRPAYLGIRDFAAAVAPGHFAAFTATATPEVRAHVAEALGMGHPEVVVRGFRRPNLTLTVHRCAGEDDRRARLLALLGERHGAGPTLVYARTRKQTEETAAALAEQGMRARPYHAGLDAETRAAAQDAFRGGGLDALVATNAFGMGIDKADLRTVVHVSLPMSLEDWYQELGRAGRDGEPAENVVLWCGKDARTAEFLIQRGEAGDDADPERVAAFRAAALRRLARVRSAFHGDGCLWRTLLEYFGDPDAAELAEEGCGACTPCLDPREAPVAVAGEDDAFLRTVLQGCIALGGRFGRRKVAAILAGSRAQGVPTFHEVHGLLQGHAADRVAAAVDALLEAGYLAREGDEYPLVAATGKGRRAFLEEGELVVRWPPPESAAAPRSGRAAPAAADEPPLGPDEVERFERLRAWRRDRAAADGVPPYVVAPDRTLRALARERPRDAAGLLAVHGLGPARVERYGEGLLAALEGGGAD